MSGTSADSLDAVLVDFSNNTPEIVSTYSHPIHEKVRLAIHHLAVPGEDEIAQLRQLDQIIALLSCEAIHYLIKQSGHQHTDIRAIGSHGQTIRHYPKTATLQGYSLQIGDPNIIAEKTGITTVADFRRRDIAANGHGAPLATTLHHAFFQSSDTNRVILNLGGIANITLLPASTNQAIIGYDTGPANGLMDSWCQHQLNKSYDHNGEWAKSGRVNSDLLKQLLEHPYFSLATPKSTGREDFNLPWLIKELETFTTAHNFLPQPEDIQTTLLALTVESVSQQIEKNDATSQAEVYLCGGGSHNSLLVEALKQRLHPRKVLTTDTLGLHPDWVEAVAFAWLAKCTMEKKAGNIPSVTGANRNVVLGGIYWGG